ncbi:MAG: sugar ABC transporter permease [Acidimicrobiales bacterium]|nr:sugar ABC transporter permease [Acidimicrobiales bacterium]
MSSTQTPEHVKKSRSTAPPVSKRPSISVGAVTAGVAMLLVFALVLYLIVASILGAVPESLADIWPDFVVVSQTPVEKFGLMFLAVGLFVAVMAVLLISVDSRKRVPNWTVVLAFIGPTVAMLTLGLLYPMISTFVQSFAGRQPWTDPERREWVGFDNFTTLFTESTFQIVLRNTLVWVLLAPLVALGLGLLYAVLVDRTRGEAVSKGLIFLPMAISMVASGIIWKFVYEYKDASLPQIGLANQVLVWLGLDPYQFILEIPWNTLFLIVVMIWIQTGFAMTVLSAAIKAIPDDIIEAARLDGVTGFGMFRYVTVPSIRPALLVVWVTVTMTTLKAFDIVRTMTGGNFQTSVVANEFYTQSFQQFNFGLGAALAVVLFIIVIPVITYQVRQLRLSEEIR